MSGFVTAAIGAIFGLVSGLCIQWWKSARDELGVLCNEFCATVAQSADVASQYWLSPPHDQDAHLKQVRVAGFQKRLIGYIMLTSQRLHDDAVDDIEDAFARYFDACTGGEFGSPDRSPSIEGAALVQDRAGDAIFAIRQGFFATVNFSDVIWRRVSKLWPMRRKTRPAAITFFSDP